MKVVFRCLMMLAVAVAAMVSCTAPGKPVQSDFSEIPASGWAYGDTVTLVVPPDSMVADSRLVVAVRHSASYRYANVWLEITVPRGDTVFTDTVDVVLADKFGRRLGRGSGVSFMKVDTLPRTYHLTDTTVIGLRHIMRVDTLSDIEQVGIIVI